MIHPALAKPTWSYRARVTARRWQGAQALQERGGRETCGLLPDAMTGASIKAADTTPLTSQSARR
jgi:hypothetical protein